MEHVNDTSKSLINSESGIINDAEPVIPEAKDFIEQEKLENGGDSRVTISTDDMTFSDDNSSLSELADKSEVLPEWEDILGSGSLMRKIITAGEPNNRPQRLDICTLNYKCTLDDGTVVETVENGTVQLGDLEVTQGLDLALALMDVGEKCILRVEGRLAYGSQGLGNIVPPDTTVLYDVELLKVEPEEEIETLSIAQRKKLGDKKKQRGNWWYGRGECTFAIQCYRRALDYLDEVEGGIIDPKSENDDPVQRAMTDTALQELMEDRINVSNNMAAAQMKLGAYDAALQSLQIVLRCQPNNVKALYRKAKVLKAKNEVQDAMKYLLRAKTLEPENATIQKEIYELNAVLKKHKNYEKELAKRMFNNSGDGSSPVNGDKNERNSKSFIWASVALSVAVGVAGVMAWRFKFS